jgi:hypothetical protein
MGNSRHGEQAEGDQDLPKGHVGFLGDTRREGRRA